MNKYLIKPKLNVNEIEMKLKSKSKLKLKKILLKGEEVQQKLNSKQLKIKNLKKLKLKFKFKGEITMRTNLKVFLAENNKEMVNTLKAGISKTSNMEVIGHAYDGKDALKQLKELKPDVALIDCVLPEMDGLEVLDKIKEAKLGFLCIMTSALDNEKIVHIAREKGADYFLAKPFNLDSLIDNIWKLNGNSFKKMKYLNIEERATSILHELGVPAHIRGYHFVREAIILAVNRPEIINFVTKELYPMIAVEFKTTHSRVERAIRHAIEVAWTRGNVDAIDRIFGYTVNTNKGKPTNSEFVALLADMIRIEMKRLQ